MRKRIAGILAAGVTALSAVVAAATPAAAAPVPPWNISPGGNATGTAGVTNLVVHDPQNGDILLTCDSASAGLVLDVGTSSDNQLGTIPGSGVEFLNCLAAGFLQFTVDAVDTWTLNGATYANGVITGSIDEIKANISGPGCEMTVEGSVGATYTNNDGKLAVDPTPTLTVTFVDAVNNCSDLIHAGATAGFDGVFTVDPIQTITG